MEFFKPKFRPVSKNLPPKKIIKRIKSNVIILEILKKGSVIILKKA